METPICKVVYKSSSEGEFRLSIAGIKMFLERKGVRDYRIMAVSTNSGYSYYVSNQSYAWDHREDKDLVAVVESLGEHAGDRCELSVASMTKGTRYRIRRSSDGAEYIEYPESIEWQIAGSNDP